VASISPNPPPLKIPRSIEPGSDVFKFIDRLLRSFYTIWNRVNNSVNNLTILSTAVGNVGSGEDTLITYELDANTLEAGQAVRITAWGKTANNGDTKTLKLYFGSLIFTNALPTSVAGQWKVEAIVSPTTKNAQDYMSSLVTLSTQDIESGSLTETDSSAITIKCTGEATTTNDIVQEGLLVEYLY